MDAKEAIKFLQDNLDARPASEGYLGVSFWRTELEEVIKALREALEWQPMETCPEKAWVWCKFRVPATGAVYVSVFTKSVHGEFYNWMTQARIEPELMIAHIVLPMPEVE